MIRREWLGPTVLMPAGFVEDPTVFRVADNWLRLYYTRGDKSLQDQRPFYRDMTSPIGPVGEEKSALGIFGTHTRIERARVRENLWLHTVSWPGPPTGGIMAFQRFVWGTTRSIVLTVKPGTGYSFIAANPCVVPADDPGEYEIVFEGCADKACDWHLFLARWREGELARVDDEPSMRGANPSLVVHDGVRYLYYSALTPAGYAAGFETRVVSQPV